MNSPFKLGDIVYHSRFGQGTACKHDTWGGNYQKVTFPHEGLQDCHLANLSFTPWPKPNHVRPFGAVLKYGEAVIVKPNDGGVPFTILVGSETEHTVISSCREYLKSKYTFHRIGEAIQFN